MDSKKKFLPISGTFIDGICADIPSNNWQREDWALQFDTFKQDNIDTVIIIRVGFADSAMYKSEVMKTTLYDDEDLVEILLKEAERVGINLYIGLYDTHYYWAFNDWDNEVAINKELIYELYERYNKFSAFKGWYMCHECSLHTHSPKVWQPLCETIRSLDKERPIITSPRYHGPKADPKWPVPPDVHVKHFDYILNEMQGLISAYAFMDGHVHFKMLPEYVKVTSELFQKHNISFWSNLETFDRDMPWKFPPIEWNKFRYKLETVQPYVDKIISFELPHFLSPYSMWPSARNLHKKYISYLKNKDVEK